MKEEGERGRQWGKEAGGAMTKNEVEEEEEEEQEGE